MARKLRIFHETSKDRTDFITALICTSVDKNGKPYKCIYAHHLTFGLIYLGLSFLIGSFLNLSHIVLRLYVVFRMVSSAVT